MTIIIPEWVVITLASLWLVKEALGLIVGHLDKKLVEMKKEARE